MNKYKCPCCGYPTLEERHAWEICCLCNWEDDGQDDPHADEIRGGPNGDYSLTEARENFKKFLTMYRDKINILSQTEKEFATKRSMIEAFEKLRTTPHHLESQLWEEIERGERILDDIVHESTENYSKNVEKYREILNLINSEESDTKVKGLISLAYSADDRDFAQELMVRYSQHSNENIRGIAILCFGHIARIHRKINKKLVMPIILDGLNDKSQFVRGHSQSALDDINMFCK